MNTRKGILISVLALSAVFLLQDCRHDPAPARGGGANDPDSLYTGKPYYFATIPHFLREYKADTIPSDNPMTYEGVLLGRMLFYDSTISLTKRLSCSNCHQQQYAFGSNVAFRQNVLGTNTRNAPALMNLMWFQRFFWDGRTSSIEATVTDALNNEMHPDFTAAIKYLSNTPQYAYLFKKAFGRPGDVTQEKMIKAISQFLRTLQSVNSRIDQYYRGDILLTQLEADGLNDFFDPNNGDCYHCHSDGLLTFSNQARGVVVANNGLNAETHLSGFPDLGYGGAIGDSLADGMFRIPTLRNVAVSAPYMHDGRFNSLGEVLDHYSDGLLPSPEPSMNPGFLTHINSGGLHIDAHTKSALLAFLNALTDTSYLHNPAYSNPFH